MDTSGMTGREAALASASEEDRTLIVAVSQDLSTLDWDASGAFPRMTETQVNVLGSWAQPAIVELEDGSMVGDALNFEPMLADSMVISMDGTQWTFKLPEGMKHYPSGNEITANDYLYYKDRRGNMRVPPSLDRLVRLATKEEPLKGFEVIDDYTFRFNASDWTPILRPFMSCCQFGLHYRQPGLHGCRRSRRRQVGPGVRQDQHAEQRPLLHPRSHPQRVDGVPHQPELARQGAVL